MSARRLRLEALIASPPTRTCEVIVDMLDALVEKYPDFVSLDIYLAGEQPGRDPTKGYQDKGKFKRVPSVFVNGVMAAQVEAPEPASLAALLVSELAKGAGAWQE